MNKEYLKKYIICYHIPPIITLGTLYIIAHIVTLFSIEVTWFKTVILTVPCVIVGLHIFSKFGKEVKATNLGVYIFNLVLYSFIILLVLGINVFETKFIIYLIVMSIMIVLLNIYYRNDLFRGD